MDFIKPTRAEDGAEFGESFELQLLQNAVPASDRRLAERDDPSRRRHLRVELAASARLRGGSQGAVETRIVNLSEGGCSLALQQRSFFEGAHVTVKIDGFEPWPGIVKWSRDGQLGIAFERPFYPAVFDAIVARSGIARSCG